MTVDELAAHFSTYLEQIPRLKSADAYWALLHYIVIFPDICGALESADARATGERYRNWASRYLHEPVLMAEDWYEIRCILLHQGKTLGKKRYALYRFGQPGTISHGHQDPNTATVDLNVSEMADQMISGMQSWFKDVVAQPTSPKSLNVQRNLRFIAECKVLIGNSASPLQLTQMVSITTNS
jgi:hypothetical protein